MITACELRDIVRVDVPREGLEGVGGSQDGDFGGQVCVEEFLDEGVEGWEE